MTREREGQSKEFKTRRGLSENVARFIRKGVENLGLGEKETFELLRAVDEAVANIREHAYKGKVGKIKIKLIKEDKNLKIELRDKGRPFDLKEVGEYDPRKKYSEDLPLGFFILQSCVDEVKFESGSEGNVLTLIKKL